jgi:phenylacetate-coenzyme A ligase PaaK-like adenylate-forming protein
MLRLPDKNYYAVHNDSFVVNVVDENGQLARQGRVIITPLYKTDLPLINYEVGDRAEMRTSQGVHFITSMDGRLNDYFRYEDGRVTSFFEVTPVIAHCQDILQIRFIEKSYDLIHVQIVRDEKAKMSREELEEYLSSNLNRIFKKPFRFEFEWMDVIPPDENGKLRMIVCEAG